MSFPPPPSEYYGPFCEDPNYTVDPPPIPNGLYTMFGDECDVCFSFKDQLLLITFIYSLDSK